MKKIVLTGFGSFGDNTVNPAESIVRALEKEEGITVFVLPVVYDRCAKVIGDTDGEIYLHLGLASSRERITVERYAYNEKNAKAADNDGILFSGEKIVEGGENILTTPFDTERIVRALEGEEIESAVSTDPGRYVCNNIYYHSLTKGRKALFVHLPPLEKLSCDEGVRAVRIIIGEIRSQA